MKLDIFKKSTVIVTGHTGFKGTWLSIWLKQLGATVHGVSFDIPSNPSHFRVANLSSQIVDHRLDVRDSESLEALVQEIQPDFVFHLAAQALVRPSYENPLETISTNALGTASLLNALRSLEKSVVAIMITSDKAYDNFEWVWGYRETDRLGGKDPYSASKGMAELVIRSYVESFFNSSDSNIRVGIARAGNVIGGGDWSLDRIIPDCVKSWYKKKKIIIRNPKSTRPWQHVFDAIRGYLILAIKLENTKIHGEVFNFGPENRQNKNVINLVKEIEKNWKEARWRVIKKNNLKNKESNLLKLNSNKAKKYLNWYPILNFSDSVKFTADWYIEFKKRGRFHTNIISKENIIAYNNLLKLKKIKAK